MSQNSNSMLNTAIQAFDDLNRNDPNKVEINGKLVPKALHEAEQMSKWIETLYPDASEVVQLAARCQHLCRWEIPRSSYPDGRESYLKWRNDLKKFHAQRSAEVLQKIGYDDTTIDAVKTINLKKGLRSNSDVQAVEDALCIVFLESQFESYIGKWTPEKIISILQKTWIKMSPIAQAAAMNLELSNEAKALISKALESSSSTD